MDRRKGGGNNGDWPREKNGYIILNFSCWFFKSFSHMRLYTRLFILESSSLFFCFSSCTCFLRAFWCSRKMRNMAMLYLIILYGSVKCNTEGNCGEFSEEVRLGHMRDDGGPVRTGDPTEW